MVLSAKRRYNGKVKKIHIFGGIAMSAIDKSENVKAQYSDDKNLSIRIRLHSKHSANKQGFIPWLFENYELSKSRRILELGCGNGSQWEGRIGHLPSDCLLILSDLSEGMVEEVWRKYRLQKNVLVQQIDIQSIPFPNESFDIVIANHMLYHVPDLCKALLEVNRILKQGGKFYAATNGSGGMRLYLHDALKRFNPNINAFNEDFSFNLQNGHGILSGYFGNVRRIDYEDSLSITETRDLIEWIESTISIAGFSENSLAGLYDYFEGIRKKEGAINIPKETGLFVSVK
jgi:ubiquinone/menaquinone biosynthesis C-methylase UbiE